MDDLEVLCGGYLSAMKDVVPSLTPQDVKYIAADLRVNLTKSLQTAMGLTRLSSRPSAAGERITTPPPVDSTYLSSSSKKYAEEVDVAAIRKLENIIGLKLMQHGGDPTRPFLLYDTEGLGKLTPNDFRRAINGMGVRLTDGELRSLMSRYDSDGDGLLNYVDFAALATGATAPLWGTEYGGEYMGLSAEHSMSSPRGFGVSISESRRLQLLEHRIRAKLRSHTESAGKLYLNFKTQSDSLSGALGLPPLRAGLRKFGLNVSLEDLGAVLYRFAPTDPGRSITLSELQSFLDNTPPPINDDDRPQPVSSAASSSVTQKRLPPVFRKLVTAFRGDYDSLFKALQRFDAHRTGFITREVLSSVFTLKGISLSSAELKELVSILGGSSDKVPYQLLTDILASYRITDDVEEPTMTISGTERDASPPPEATSAIRRTHSDTTDVRKPVLDELYRTTEPTVPPKASSQDSSGRKVKTGDYRPPSPILPMSLLSRIANAFVGLHSHAVYKRLASTASGISPDDLAHGMKLLGCGLSKLDVKAIMGQFDKNRDGYLDRNEFLALFSSTT